MKTNFMMVIVFVSIVTLTTLFGFTAWTNKAAMEQGLEQCRVFNQDKTHFDILWRKNCNSGE